MSLKAIKDLVVAVENLPAEFRLSGKAEAAHVEVLALEKAAKAIAQWRDRPSSVTWDAIASACDLMETIAKEAE